MDEITPSQKQKAIAYWQGCIEHYQLRIDALKKEFDTNEDRLIKARSVGADQESNKYYPDFKKIQDRNLDIIREIESTENEINANQTKINKYKKHEI